MKQYEVRPSVNPICPLQQHVAGLLLWAEQIEDTTDCCSRSMQQWTVPRCQRTQEAKHRLGVGVEFNTPLDTV